MRNITVRLAEPKDAEKFLQYELGTKENGFDPEAGLYPNSITLCTENEYGVPVVYLPAQPTFMLEALGICPDADKKDVALSLRRLIDKIVETARSLGMGEIYFGCTEPRTIAFAEHHGFKEVPFKMFRLKLKEY